MRLKYEPALLGNTVQEQMYKWEFYRYLNVFLTAVSTTR